MNAALAEVDDEALEVTRDGELSLEQRRANKPERISELRQELERRNIHILSGHSFDRLLGSLLTGNARVTDGDDGVAFEVDLPVKGDIRKAKGSMLTVEGTSDHFHTRCEGSR